MAEVSSKEYIDRNAKFAKIISRVETGDPLHPGRDNLLNENVMAAPLREKLKEHVELLEKFYGFVDVSEPPRDKIALDVRYIFNFIIPVLIRDTNAADAMAGIHAIEKFEKKFEAGENIWAACIASSSNPTSTLRSLLEEFDNNKSFAHWVSDETKVGEHDILRPWFHLWHATEEERKEGNPLWSEEETDIWQILIERIGAWKKLAVPHLPEFTLSPTGYALGSEIEVRNRDSTGSIDEGKEWEILTPHTNNLKGFAAYLEQVKKYFVDTEGFFPPGYYWGLHLNLSLTEAAKDNVQNNGSILSEVAHLLLTPSNPYSRNIHKPKNGFQDSTSNNISSVNVQLKNTAPITVDRDRQGKNHDDPRCPERKDEGRLEIKCCAVWAGMDVPYIMNSMHMMHILTENPRLIASFKQEAEELYESTQLKTPERFSNSAASSVYDLNHLHVEVPEAEQYHLESVIFREKMTQIYEKYFLQFGYPDTWPNKEQIIPLEETSWLHRTKTRSDNRDSPIMDRDL